MHNVYTNFLNAKQKDLIDKRDKTQNCLIQTICHFAHAHSSNFNHISIRSTLGVITYLTL
jgi:hypothetical protein